MNVWLCKRIVTLGRNRSELKRRHNKKGPWKQKWIYIKQTEAVGVALKWFLTQTAINQGAHTLLALMVAAFSMRQCSTEGWRYLTVICITPCWTDCLVLKLNSQRAGSGVQIWPVDSNMTHQAQSCLRQAPSQRHKKTNSSPKISAFA